MAEMDRKTIYPPAEPEYGLSGDAVRREQIEGGGVGTAPAPAEGMLRYPTEPATSRAGVRHALSSARWPVLGAVLGAGGALWWMRRRRT
jgi:hypothetical protein